MSVLELKDKRILVTGGAGFIGSHLVDKLLKKKAKVIVYDNFDDFYPGKEKNVEGHLKDDRFRLVRGDILDFEGVVSVMSGVDAVFHLAAQCGVRYCNRHPRKAHQVNAGGTFNVLMAAREVGVERVVYASSSGIFGVPQYAPIDEQHPTNPTSPYGVSKLAGEKYALAFEEVYGLDIACLRYFSVYGPRGRPDQVIYAFASAIVNGERPVIFGDGNQTRDFTHVWDVVEATVLAAECEKAGGEIFNIGFGREYSVNDVFARVVKKLGKKDEIEPVYEESYGGEFPRTLADNSKAEKILGWKPKVEFDTGLDTFMEWLLRDDEV